MPIVIHPLTDGYVLETETGKFAYTTVSALAKGVKEYLAAGADRDKLVRFQPRTAPPPAPAAQPRQASAPATVVQHTVAQLPPVERQNLLKLMTDWASGKLADKARYHALLDRYAPSLDKHAAEAILAEFVADFRSDDA